MKKVRLSDLNADSNLSEIAEKVRYGYLVQILCAPLELPVPTHTFLLPSQVCMLAFQSLCVCGGGCVSSPLFFKFSSPNIHILTSFALMPLLPLFSPLGGALDGHLLVLAPPPPFFCFLLFCLGGGGLQIHSASRLGKVEEALMSLRRRMLLEGAPPAERAGGTGNLRRWGRAPFVGAQSGEAVTAPRPSFPRPHPDDVDDYVELMYDDETKVTRQHQRKRAR